MTISGLCHTRDDDHVFPKKKLLDGVANESLPLTAHTETLTTQQEDGTECGETEKMTGRLFTNGRFQTKPLTKIPNHVRYSIEV
jgi:hypothetical protein